MDSPSDAEVIGRSLSEPEAFGLIYDRHAATLLRFLGRRAGAKVAEGLVGELFRIAFERTPVAVRNRLEPVAEAPAWRGPAAARQRADGDGSGGGGRARERPGARRARAVLARGRRDRGAAGRRARGAPALRVGGTLVPERGRGSRAADRHGTLAAQPRLRELLNANGKNRVRAQ